MRKSTDVGRKFEIEIRDRLETEGIKYIEQPSDFPEHISITVTPDFLIPDINLYVFAQQDFWNGGQQSDRFGHVVQMNRFVWRKGEVFYTLKRPGIFKNEPKRWTDKQILKQNLYNQLTNDKVVGSIDNLMERINGAMS